MSELIEYKGFLGSVHFSSEDEVFHGRLEFIRDLVTFEATTAKELKQAFYEAVEDYLDMCVSEGKEPETPLKGSFNVRTGPDLHRRAMLYAKRHDQSLNALVSEALLAYLNTREKLA
jgi:predicted HicB family RNase H-like nuclease